MGATVAATEGVGGGRLAVAAVSDCGDAVAADAPLVILAAAAWIYPSPGRSGHREAALWRQREGEGNGYVWGGRGVNTGQAADFEGRNACGMVLR